MNETEQLIISAHKAERERCARVALHLATNTDDPVVRALALMIADMVREGDESAPALPARIMRQEARGRHSKRSAFCQPSGQFSTGRNKTSN
jgi:hypothetical protein